MEDKKRLVSLDEMIEVVGPFNKFQWILDAMFCMMLVPQTFQALIMYFGALDPGWRCTKNSSICLSNETMSPDNNARCSMPRTEWEFTEAKDFSIITQFDINCNNMWLANLTSSALFIGWGIGAVVLGWIADNYGRKIVLFPATMTLLVLGLFNSFAPNIESFIAFRFFIGFVTPGVGVQSFILISEIVGGKFRPLAGIILWFFFTVALCILGLKAYLIRQWKTLFIVCTVPYVFVIFFYTFVPESVRWLHLHGETDKLNALFKRIAKWNNKVIPENVTLIKSDSHDGKKHKSSPLDLFRTSKIAKSTLVQGYAWFVYGMTYYGLALAAGDLGGSLYLNYVLVSVVEFPAIIIAIDFCERFGRKKTVIYPMIVGGLSCALVAAVPAEGNIKILRVMLGLLGKLCITISFDAIYTWSLELFSTDIRAEGMGFLQVTSRAGAASAPWIAKSLKIIHTSIPFITMGALTLIGSGFLFILPETKDNERADGKEDDSLHFDVNVDDNAEMKNLVGDVDSM